MSRWPQLEDEEWLRERYFDDRLTRKQIGRLIGCSTTRVSNAMKAHGIKTRSSREAAPRSYPQLADADWLRERYVDQQKTSDDIADELGCTAVNVLHALRGHGIPARKGRAAQLSRKATSKVEDGDWLRDRYVTEKMTMTDIADLIGTTHTTVRNALRHHGIPMRSASENRRLRTERALGAAAARRLFDEDWLRMMYLERELPTTKISEILGVSARAVNHALKRAGIDTRSSVEAQRLSVGMSEETAARLADASWLHHAYVVQLRPAKHIASELGVSDGTVQNALKRHGVRLRSVEQARQVYHRAAINGYDAAKQKHLLSVARDAGAVGKAYTDVIRLLGAMDKVPYSGREESRLEREAMDGLYRAQDALAQRLMLGSDDG